MEETEAGKRWQVSKRKGGRGGGGKWKVFLVGHLSRGGRLTVSVLCAVGPTTPSASRDVTGAARVAYTLTHYDPAPCAVCRQSGTGAADERAGAENAPPPPTASEDNRGETSISAKHLECVSAWNMGARRRWDGTGE